MARRPVSMRKTKEILRLKHELGLTNRQIAASLHLSHTCVGQYLRRIGQAGIGWPLPEPLDEDQLRQLLLAAQKPPPESKRYLPPLDEVHRELRRKGVTLQLVWEEYHRAHPDGYGHTQFWEYYRRFCAQLDPALRQAHPAGERMFVDWAGLTIPLVDPQTGQSRPAHLFVAVLGASNYTYTEAFENTQLPSWIEAHVHAWEWRENRALATRLSHARLKQPACIEDLDFSPARGLKRALLEQLSPCDWVQHRQNIIIPVSAWHEVVPDPTVADALLDRLIHNAHRLELKGDSLRKRNARTYLNWTRSQNLQQDRMRTKPPTRSGSVRQYATYLESTW